MDALVHFLNSPLGRAFRVALGVALIAYGLLGLGGLGGAIVAIVGLVPLALGATGRCLLEPLAHPAS